MAPKKYHRPIGNPEVSRRLQITLDLCDAAEEIKRQNLRRLNPSATEAEIEEGIRQWYRDKPPETDTDCSIRPVDSKK